MIRASRWYQAGVAGPAGNPGVKSVGIRLENNASWRHEEIVYIQPGSDAHEQEQLDHAVENLMKAHGKTAPWKWA
jgi:hypothetical protein